MMPWTRASVGVVEVPAHDRGGSPRALVPLRRDGCLRAGPHGPPARQGPTRSLVVGSRPAAAAPRRLARHPTPLRREWRSRRHGHGSTGTHRLGPAGLRDVEVAVDVRAWDVLGLFHQDRTSEGQLRRAPRDRGMGPGRAAGRLPVAGVSVHTCCAGRRSDGEIGVGPNGPTNRYRGSMVEAVGQRVTSVRHAVAQSDWIPVVGVRGARAARRDGREWLLILQRRLVASLESEHSARHGGVDGRPSGSGSTAEYATPSRRLPPTT